MSLGYCPHLRIMDEVHDGPFQHCGGGFHSGSKDVSHGPEEVVVIEAHRLCSDPRRVVVLGAALGSQQSVQQVPLHVVTVVCLGGVMSMYPTQTHTWYMVQIRHTFFPISFGNQMQRWLVCKSGTYAQKVF